MTQSNIRNISCFPFSLVKSKYKIFTALLCKLRKIA